VVWFDMVVFQDVMQYRGYYTTFGEDS
jgi:hypothetical protein